MTTAPPSRTDALTERVLAAIISADEVTAIHGGDRPGRHLSPDAEGQGVPRRRSARAARGRPVSTVPIPSTSSPRATTSAKPTLVSTDRANDFVFPTGRAWAEEFGYRQLELERVPDASAGRFAGVANSFSLCLINPGETVLDPGRGSGTKLLIAGGDRRAERPRDRRLHDTGDARSRLLERRGDGLANRRKAAEFGAMGSTIRATKPQREE
jgi:hypothetical protein